MAFKTQATPGEIVLANRIRQVHPARLRDELPKDDEDLLDLVRLESGVLSLDNLHARNWSINSYLKLTKYGIEDTEKELMRHRIGTYFATRKESFYFYSAKSGENWVTNNRQ